VYDFVLKQDVRLRGNTKLPAGSIAENRHGKTLVHRGSRKWQSTALTGEFISEPEDKVNQLRFAQIAQGEIAEENKTVHTFSLFDDLSDLELNEFEKLLIEENKISHFEQIVTHPVLDLHRDELKMPIGRVKRFSPLALSHLSGHSEDWQNRTFTSVIPKNLYAIVQEDLWSTYENRLFASICEAIDNYLTERLTAYNQVEKSFDEIIRYYNNLPEYYQKIRERYGKRVKDYFDEKESHEEESERLLKETKSKLEKLQKTIRGFWATELFKKLGHSAPLSLDNIHATNLLQHHQHYRYVLIIRSLFLKTKGTTKESGPDELEREQFKFCSDISRYVELCIAHILKDDGFIQIKAKKFMKGKCDIKLTNVLDNEIVLKMLTPKYIKPIRFISLPSDPGDYYSDEKSKFSGDTVIVFPAPGGILSFLNGEGNNQTYQYRADIGSIFKIAISTLSIFSEEIISSILFKWLKTPILMEYPQSIKKVPSAFIEYLFSERYKDCLSIRGSEVTIIKPIQGIDPDFLHKDFNRKIRQSSKLQKQVLQLSSIIEDLTEGSKLAEGASSCFVCSEKAAKFKPDSRGIFDSECNLCNVRWGKNQSGEFYFWVEREKQHGESEPFPNLGRYGKISGK